MSNTPSQAVIRKWLCEPMSPEVEKSVMRLASADDVQHIAIMPDVHLANDVCIGTAVATSELIYPAAVGGDIGCGMAAVRFEADASLLETEMNAGRMLTGLHRLVPTNRHSATSAPHTIGDDLAGIGLSDTRLEKQKTRDGRVQLGTLGRGNHFLEFQADQEERLWLMIHSGSRAMGQMITKHHLANTSASSHGLAFIEAASERGVAYLSDVEWAERYAEQNRIAMVRTVAEFMKSRFAVHADWSSLIHGNHNHVRRETHFGKPFWVHRKGALSSQSDEAGIIPGSMATASFHVSGRGCLESLCSSSHGAGRKLSRKQACQTITTRQLHRQMQGVWFDYRQARSLRDESPLAYKDIHAVMRAQKSLTRILRELRPLLSYKG